MNKLLEETTKAAQTAELLCSDLKQAHSAAIRCNRLAELLCYDLLLDVHKLKQRIGNLSEAVRHES